MKKSEALVVGAELAILLGLLLPTAQRSGHDPWVAGAVLPVLFWPEVPLRWAGLGEGDLGVFALVPRILGVVSWGLAFGYALFWVVSRVRKRGKRHAL